MDEQKNTYTGPVYNAQGQQIDPQTGEVIQGAPAGGPTVININNTATATATGVDPFVSPKKKWVAFWLCFFGGFFGLHRFYVGKFGSGIAYLFTGGIIGIGYFIDLFKILTNSFRDRDGRRLQH